MEGGRDTVVGLLESDNLESTNIIYAMQLVSGTGTESSTSDSDFAHLLDDMSQDVLNGSGQPMMCGGGLHNPAYLDGAKRSAREFQCPLDLESMGS